MTIAEEWLSDLRTHLRGQPRVTDVRVGVFYTAVKLSTGHVGLAFTPRQLGGTVCCPRAAAAAPPAGNLVGVTAWEIAEYAAVPSPLWRALGVATLNALSATATQHGGFPKGVLAKRLDALTAAQIDPLDRVVMVGAFAPFLGKLKGQVADLAVIDKHRDALGAEEHYLWVAPEQADQVLRRADVLIMSGSALVEGGIEDLIRLSPAARTRVLAGPTTPMWPTPFFAHGIDVLGGIRAVDAGALMQIAGEGGSGYLFEQTAFKICLLPCRSGPLS